MSAIRNALHRVTFDIDAILVWAVFIAGSALAILWVWRLAS